MLNALLTSLQIFGIGFSFGIAGPCFLNCAPILITYIAGSKKKWTEALNDISIFLGGRLLAYIILGALAGLSGGLLRHFTNSNLILFFKPLAGIISILLGISVLKIKEPFISECKPSHNKIYNLGGLFALGFLIGISPCAPLLALLFEITLISKTAFEGMSYGASFGLGTLFSGFLVVGILTGVLNWLPARFLKSKISNFVFKITCALLLILFGLSLILHRAPLVAMKKF